MADYRLSPRAQRDLDAIFDYTVTHWDLSQAIRYADLIAAACADLAEAPSAVWRRPASAKLCVRLSDRAVFYGHPEKIVRSSITPLFDGVVATHAGQTVGGLRR